MRARGRYARADEMGGGENHTRTFLKALPYLWPKGEWCLRFTVIISILLLVVGKLGALLLPVLMGLAVDMLTGLDGVSPEFPLWYLVGYGLVRFGADAMDQLRDIIFAKLAAQIERTIAREIFQHLQGLSLEFHLSRKTGAVLRSISRGAGSFALVLRVVLFQIAPVFLQVAVVCTYLALEYDWYYSVVTFSVIFFYIIFTLVTTEWRNKFRRAMNKADNEFNQKGVDALLNFETVKYFNAEDHELGRYDVALREYQYANMRSQQSLSVLNGGQNLVISAGVTAVMILAGLQVVDGVLTVGDFVQIQMFILQLYLPLGFLGTYYRMLKQNLVDVESMFKLFDEEPDVKDDEDAPELNVKQGRIEFKDVHFGYKAERPILKGISFAVEPGQKVAIVGPTGSGKSTIARLLYRFYDIGAGSIEIDGQSITSVTQQSLRQEIGIVPQDCVLFNDSVSYNIGYGIYGRLPEGPTKEHVHQAAKAAALHNSVMSFKEQYETNVGERGLRLSGGEKQRVAIARAILKSPRIMVYDEATSSLDTTTEMEIQSALDSLAKGRSSITIAHRLSTIMNSDQILVVKSGVIVERGTHADLLERGGEYSTMWDRQEETARLKEGLQAIIEQERRDSVDKSDVLASISLVEEDEEPAHEVVIEVENDPEEEQAGDVPDKDDGDNSASGAGQQSGQGMHSVV